MSEYMYCIKCGTRVGPAEKKCPKCSNSTFTNIRPKGQPTSERGGLLKVMDDWEKGIPPKFF